MIDETDKKILNLLQANGRLTNAEIADQVGLSVSGGGDYILQVVAKDMDRFAEVALKKLVRLPDAKDSSSHFVLSTMKEAAGWPLSA